MIFQEKFQKDEDIRKALRIRVAEELRQIAAEVHQSETERKGTHAKGSPENRANFAQNVEYSFQIASKISVEWALNYADESPGFIEIRYKGQRAGSVSASSASSREGRAGYKGCATATN